MCRIIFRIRQLHIIRWQMLVGHKKQIMKGNPAKYLGLHLPRPEETPPAPWWTNECDHSLVVGIFKHGTEEHCTSILSTVYTFIHRVVLSFGIKSVHTWIMAFFPVLLVYNSHTYLASVAHLALPFFFIGVTFHSENKMLCILVHVHMRKSSFRLRKSVTETEIY